MNLEEIIAYENVIILSISISYIFRWMFLKKKIEYRSTTAEREVRNRV